MPLHGKISQEQFSFLAKYLADKYGLRVPPEKKTLIETRLISRVNALKLKSINEYIDFAFGPEQSDSEYRNFVDYITTHKTFFFRENHQFDFLSKLIPGYLASLSSNRSLNVWSAGCSTGEEVYTLGITLNEKKQDIPQLDYRILGTDISVPSLKVAASGFFANELTTIPESIRQKYFIEQIISGRPGVRFNNAEITSKIQLGVLNLNNKQYNIPQTFDFIFCRNVTIYFDAKTRQEVLGRIVDKLRPGGYLFLGHSETALGTTLPLKSIQPTIYRKLS